MRLLDDFSAGDAPVRPDERDPRGAGDGTSPKPRFLVVSLNPSPPAPVATSSTLVALREAFPDHEMDVVYVVDLLRRSPMTLALAAAAAGLTYAPDLLRRKKALRYAIFRTSYAFRAIRRLLRRSVRAADYAFTLQIQSLFDVSLPGVPNFVYTDHVHLENLNFHGVGWSDLYSWSWLDCEREIYRNAATTFVWSTNVGRTLVERYAMEPGRVDCVGTGSNAAIPQARPDDTGRYAGKRILFVGSDWTRKGGPTLLRAFGRVLERHPDATLTIVGDGPSQVDLPHVERVGRVPLDTLPTYYAGASVFCMPTRLEPFGNVFVEAMWQQLPVVATRVGALPDMVEDGVNGFLVPPDDPVALADRLCRLLDDPARCAAMGRAARARAETQYDWPMVARRIRRRIEAELGHPAAAGAA